MIEERRGLIYVNFCYFFYCEVDRYFEIKEYLIIQSQIYFDYSDFFFGIYKGRII